MKIICLFVGHRYGWAKARVPNPHVVVSLEYRCTRCGTSGIGKLPDPTTQDSELL